MGKGKGDLLMTVGEVAAALGVSRAAVYGYVHRGLVVPAFKGTLFNRADVLKLRGLRSGRPRKEISQ